MPTLQELIQRAKALGVEEQQTAPLTDFSIWPNRFRFLKRKQYGSPAVVIPDWRNDKRLDKVTVENWCSTLGLPKEDFGLPADD